MKITKITAASSSSASIQEYMNRVFDIVKSDLSDKVKDITWDIQTFEDEPETQYICVTVYFNGKAVRTFEFADWRFTMRPSYITSDADIITRQILKEGKALGLIKPDPEDEWEEVASKQVLDSDGFWTDYTMYYNEDEGRFVCIFGDKDLYNPTNAEPDFECEEKWEAFEWFEDYDTGEDDGEDDTIYESVSLADKFIEVHDKDEYNWNLHKTNYEPFYEELKTYMRDGETWDEEDEDGWPADTNVDLKTLFSRMPKDKQKDFMDRFWLNRDEELDDIESSVIGDLSALGRDIDEDRMDATDIVRWMYENYPDFAFIDERDLDDGRVMLLFERGPDYQRGQLLKDLDELNIEYKLTAGRLRIFAEEDPEYLEGVESSRDIYKSLPTGKYWYFTTHGVQPGSVPKGIEIDEVIDRPEGTYFTSNRVISTEALRYYDLKERAPE